MSAVIVGSGFAGIGIAIQLKKHGVHDFVILEQAGDVGGVWRDNTYPGCACDVPSHLYSFSFEFNPDWTREYGPQREIYAYLRRCADKYDLRQHIRFNDRVERCIYDERHASWTVHTQSGRAYSAQFLLNGMGGLSRPAIPSIPGLETFQGPAFHSARWNHDYDLKGKRVAVIGTGASAIQFVPGIIDQVAHVDIYQRSAPWVVPKEDGDIPAYRRAAFGAMPWLQKAARERYYWTAESRIFAFVKRPELLERFGERRAREYLEAEVQDPELRAKITPDYRMGCKRILLSNDWYAAITRDHVDVLTSGISHVTEGGVVDRDGVERPVDAIIFGTGFEAQNPVPAGAIVGRDGKDLATCWGKTPRAYKGTTVAGFPNLFLLGGPNTGIGHTSMIYMLESQFTYVLDAITSMKERRVRAIEVRQEHQDAYNERVQAKSATTVWGQGCRGWYYNADGVNTALWPDFTFHFRRQLKEFDAVAYHQEALRPGEDVRTLWVRTPDGETEVAHGLSA